MIYYGISTGDTGQYGVGDIVEGSSYVIEADGMGELDGEPVFYIFIIKDNKPVIVEYQTETSV